MPRRLLLLRFLLLLEIAATHNGLVAGRIAVVTFPAVELVGTLVRLVPRTTVPRTDFSIAVAGRRLKVLLPLCPAGTFFACAKRPFRHRLRASDLRDMLLL